jgi:hypothetical protein
VLGRVGDPEQIDGDHVEAGALRLHQGRVADAGLARTPRAGEDDVGRILDRRRDLANVSVTTDHLAGRDRLVGREQIPARLAHPLLAYTFCV